jgi:hypothetical protein
MAFIDKSVSFTIVFLTYYIMFIGLENCNNLVNFITTKKLYVINESLSETDLKISDMKLPIAIYNSLIITIQLKNVISVFSNRFVEKSYIKKSDFSIYSIVFGTYRNRSLKNAGMQCKTVV